MNFVKMTSLENDYVYVDLIKNSKLDINNIIKEVPKICNRNIGIGSDGVITIESKEDKIVVRIFNPDGSEAGICGNGLRCVGRLCHDRGYKKDNFSVFLPFIEKKVDIEVEEKMVSVNLGEAKILGNYTLDDLSFDLVDIGNLHAVLVLKEDIKNVDLKNLAKKIYKKLDKEVNIEIVNIKDKNNIELRVFEKGVGETKACGSGAAASFFSLYKKGLLKEKGAVSMLGGKLEIFIKNSNVEIKSETYYVFEGKYLSL
jgi:diaminopimelate epimerase